MEKALEISNIKRANHMHLQCVHIHVQWCTELFYLFISGYDLYGILKQQHKYTVTCTNIKVHLSSRFNAHLIFRKPKVFVVKNIPHMV